MLENPYIDPRIEKIVTPEDIQRHNIDLALLDQIERADLEQITQVIDKINQTVAERPELLTEDPTLLDKMKAAIARLAELTVPKEEKETLH